MLINLINLRLCKEPTIKTISKYEHMGIYKNPKYVNIYLINFSKINYSLGKYNVLSTTCSWFMSQGVYGDKGSNPVQTFFYIIHFLSLLDDMAEIDFHKY